MLKTAPFYASVPVRDLQRARRFYEETLELGPPREVGAGLSYRCGKGTTVFMYPAGAQGASGSCGFWQVEDLRAVMSWLRERGVEFEDYDAPGLKTAGGVHEGGGTKAAWFRDSEGNVVALIEGQVH